MVAFDPEARPPAVEVVQTLRSLGDRASGPTLESFAHDHALPYIEPPLAVPGLPEARIVEVEAMEARLLLTGPDEGEELDSAWSGHEPSDEDSSGTDEMAELTAQALREHRRQRAAAQLERVRLPDLAEESTAWVPEHQLPEALAPDAQSELPRELPGEPPVEGVITPAAQAEEAQPPAPLPPAGVVAPPAPPPAPVERPRGGQLAALGALGVGGIALIGIAVVIAVMGAVLVLLL
jgi:hypothetical protein